jgi:hypothetical protein
VNELACLDLRQFWLKMLVVFVEGSIRIIVHLILIYPFSQRNWVNFLISLLTITNKCALIVSGDINLDVRRADLRTLRVS